ncbi:Uncharacterized protein DBV15_05656 [Temnothorax longispinosus]|uniref:Uncharacterized protein n=1 Tax=Temnothorax longispinosus TaxID=300112 RepID=A0A4S2JMD4_9HYME|nr:Uncharacterized protein DBV15_05656 [Temnothorax longispinosus]
MTLRLASTERNTNRMAWDDTERDETRWVGIRFHFCISQLDASVIP